MKKNTIIVLFLMLHAAFLHGYIKSALSDVLDKSASNETVQASKYDLRGAAASGLSAPAGNFFGTKFQPCAQNSNNDTLGCCTGEPTDLSNADFTGADFSNAAAAYVNFSNANFTNVTAINTDFSGSYFKGATFTGMQLVDLTVAANMMNNSSTPPSPLVTAEDLESQLSSSSTTSDGIQISDYQLTVFCNAVMPDGTICSGDSWTDTDGNVFKCNCPTTTTTDSSS